MLSSLSNRGGGDAAAHRDPRQILHSSLAGTLKATLSSRIKLSDAELPGSSADSKLYMLRREIGGLRKASGLTSHAGHEKLLRCLNFRDRSVVRIRLPQKQRRASKLAEQ